MNADEAYRKVKFQAHPNSELGRVGGPLVDEIDRMRQVITAYVEDVSNGERFDELVCLVPGLVSDDGVYGDVGATIRERA
jgi:hypothetical protein